MLTYVINIIILIISFLPKYKNIPNSNTLLNNDNNSPLKEELRNTEESIILKDSYSPILLFIAMLKYNPENLKKVEDMLTEENIKSLLEDYFESEEDFEFIYNITNDCKNTGKCIDDLIQIIKNNNTILDYIIPFIKTISNNETTVKEKWQTSIKILHNVFVYHEDFFEYLYQLTEQYPDLFYLLRFVKKDRDIDIEPIISFIRNNSFIIFDLFKNIFQSYGTQKPVEILSKFIIDNIDKTLELISLNNTEVFAFFAPFIRGDEDDMMQDFIASIFEQQKTFSKLLNIFLNNKTLLIDFAELIGITKDKETTFIHLPNFISKSKDLISISYDIIVDYIATKSKTLSTIDFIGALLRQILNTYVTKNKDNIYKELSYECITFLNYTLLGYVNDKKIRQELGNGYYDKNVSFFYIYKFLFDTTKEKNDLLTYENCLYNTQSLGGNSEGNLNYLDHSPSFIVSLVDLAKNNTNIKKNYTYFDKYNFIFGACFPQGKKSVNNTFNYANGTTSYYHCTIKDYTYMMEKMLEAFIETDNIHIDPIEINSSENPEFSWKNLIPFFILLIPAFIYLFLFSYRHLSKKETKKVIMFYKNEEKINREEEKDYNLIDNNNAIPKMKKIRFYPKWYLILNFFFNVKESINELFNYDSNKDNNTNMSNRGLIYIKGIIGISTLLTILGQLFLVFLNIPMKNFGLYQFHELISHIAYTFIFIGLRYSPRIIFSCSGFTLTYKYLSFIDEVSSYYFIKFFFRQFYKYIMLFIYVFFLRYSLYDIICFFGIKPMWKIFDRQELKRPQQIRDLFLNMFNIGVFIDVGRTLSSEYQFDNTHDIFDYLWMPFNEIFFFVFGITLISIGYKAKVRIDYVIIFLILALYFFKIILYYTFSCNKGIYTTLYYYIFDYGRLILNPIFNLDFFLIGMFFGLINYSLQKGIAIDIEDIIFNFEDYGENKTFPLFSLDINVDTSLHQNRKKTSIRLASKEMIEISEVNDKNQRNIFNEKKRHSNKIKGISGINYNFKKNKKNYNSKELELMPFLKSSITVIEWLREKKDNLKSEIEKDEKYENDGKNKKGQKMRIGCFFTFILILLFSIIIFFSVLNLIIVTYFDQTIDSKEIDNNYNINDKKNEKILLENFISNPLLNCIYLFDMEIFVICIQCAFFILYMKGQYFFINFFNRNYWSFFTKSYFSFILVCNPVILLIFYQSETVVKLNIFNIFLYYCINLVFIILMTLLVYLGIDLPLKKISKCIVKGELPINNLEEDDDSDDDDSEDDDDDDEEKERIKPNKN